MSGIAGIILLDGAPVEVGQVEAMVAAMARRGPDRQAMWCRGNAGLGQALLATTPEARVGAQPWVHPDSACVVVSDSRLDNRQELLRLLGFDNARSDLVGDGELLHSAWQRWGDRCAEYLLGDFSFVLWNPAKQSLFCARDPMAVRPFYYHFSPGLIFAFASEASALLALKQVPSDIDYGRIADALVGELEGIDSTSTFHAALRRLAPAHSLVVSRSGITARKYWEAACHRPSSLPRSADEWTEAVSAQLRLAVSRRLRSDVGVGSMLSGGLDSSSVVALACTGREFDGRAFPVFSAIDSERPGPDTTAILELVAHFPIQPHFSDLADLSALLPELRDRMACLAEPFDGEMPLIACQYLAAARAGVRCVLDGMPADNLYGIGDSGRSLIGRGALWSGFKLLRDDARAHGSSRPVYAATRATLGSLLPAGLREALRARSERRDYREMLAQSVIDPAFALDVGLLARHQAWKRELRRVNGVLVAQGVCSEMETSYVHAAVERYGRVAAREGVEPRHPFLDRELVELHAWMPPGLRSRQGWSKWALRQAMTGLLPHGVAWRREHEHLGLRFNAAVMDHERAAAGPVPPNPGIISSARLQDATHAWVERRDPAAMGALLSARLVQLWLSQNTRGAGVA